jgi:hypothetical protein
MVRPLGRAPILWAMATRECMNASAFAGNRGYDPRAISSSSAPHYGGLRHTAVVRVTHFTARAFGIAVTGVEIVISHPRFYWGKQTSTHKHCSRSRSASRRSGADRLGPLPTRTAGAGICISRRRGAVLTGLYFVAVSQQPFREASFHEAAVRP